MSQAQETITENTPDEEIDDRYVEHLAEVNETQDVISSSDIVNENGVLLCKKGMLINKKTADKLVQHKLTKPIEDSITLENSIDNKYLYNRLLKLLQQYPDFQTLNDTLNFSQECKEAFQTLRLEPIIIQKLTVMEGQMSDQIDKAVFCGWLSMLLTAEMGFGKHERQEAFLAGLLHDIGFIHISPDTLRKKSDLNDEEWRAIQSHVVIGKVMLEKYRDIPEAVAMAVLEHHERCDGSGYPVSKNDTHLSMTGQIVGLTDSIHAIRVNQFEQHGRNMFDLMPYLQMNSNTFFYDVYKTIVAVLKRTSLKMTVPANKNIAQWSSSLLLRSNALDVAIDNLRKNDVFALSQELPSNKGKSLYKISQHVLSMSAQSGLVSIETQQWLQQLQKDPDVNCAADLYENELMLNELHWQLKNACRSCNDSINHASVSPGTLFKLRETFNTVALCLGDLEDKL